MSAKQGRTTRREQIWPQLFGDPAGETRGFHNEGARRRAKSACRKIEKLAVDGGAGGAIIVSDAARL